MKGRKLSLFPKMAINFIPYKFWQWKRKEKWRLTTIYYIYEEGNMKNKTKIYIIHFGALGGIKGVKEVN